MRALIDYTIRSNIRNVTDLTVTIEAVAFSDRVTTFRVNEHELATPKRLHVRNRNIAKNFILEKRKEKGNDFSYHV
jgi:hypothetical protein